MNKETIIALGICATVIVGLIATGELLCLLGLVLILACIDDSKTKKPKQ